MRRPSLGGSVVFLVAALCLSLSGSVFAADEIHWTITGQTSVTFDWRGTTSENTIRYGLTAGSYTNTITAVAPTAPNIPFSHTLSLTSFPTQYPNIPCTAYGDYLQSKITGVKENTIYHYSIACVAD